MKYILSFFMFLILFSCTNEKPPVSEGLVEDVSLVRQDSNAIRLPFRFPLKEAPGENAPDIMVLPSGTAIYPLGNISEMKTKLRFRGILYNEPWVLVKTESGKEGWIHGLVLLQETIVPQSVLTRFFLPEVITDIIRYRQSFEQLETDEEVIRLLQKAFQLREVWQDKLISGSFHNISPLSKRQLETELPGMLIHQAAKGKSVRLFINFKGWAAITGRSKGDCDERLLELYYKVYPIDSIEYFYPSWKLEADTEQAYSLLGSDLHYAILKELDQLSACTDVLQPLIDSLGRAIVNDMVQPDVLYWYDKNQGIQELEQIVKAGLSRINIDQKLLNNRLDTLKQDSLMAERIFNFRSGKTN